ncbi:MAG: GAF domain-containing protein [Pseudomonadales bacterium]
MFNDIKNHLVDAINEKTITYFKYNSENSNYNLNEIVESALNIINTSDATYHDAEHTCLVTMCGLDIMAGKLTIEGDLDYFDWVHAIVALLFHDIGYVKGILPGDSLNFQVIKPDGSSISLSEESTDAALAPFHITRGQMFIQQRTWQKGINKDLLCFFISHTEFPVPNHRSPSAEFSESQQKIAEIIGAADLIGQLADPMYDIKIPRLYYEFAETGAAERMGYLCPGDLRRGYPEFFLNYVKPHIKEALEFLSFTTIGEKWISNLNYHVFSESHKVTVEQTSMSLIKEINNLINNEKEESIIIEEVLCKVAKYKNWPLGHAYKLKLSQEDPTLHSTRIWYEAPNSADYSDFKRVTEDFIFKSGEGLPGRVYETQTVQTIRDIAKDENFPRRKMSKDIGVQAAFAFPVILSGQVRYVLEFFAAEPEFLDPPVIEFFRFLSQQLSERMVKND